MSGKEEAKKLMQESFKNMMKEKKSIKIWGKSALMIIVFFITSTLLSIVVYDLSLGYGFIVDIKRGFFLPMIKYSFTNLEYGIFFWLFIASSVALIFSFYKYLSSLMTCYKVHKELVEKIDRES